MSDRSRYHLVDTKNEYIEVAGTPDQKARQIGLLLMARAVEAIRSRRPSPELVKRVRATVTVSIEKEIADCIQAQASSHGGPRVEGPGLTNPRLTVQTMAADEGQVLVTLCIEVDTR